MSNDRAFIGDDRASLTHDRAEVNDEGASLAEDSAAPIDEGCVLARVSGLPFNERRVLVCKGADLVPDAAFMTEEDAILRTRATT